MGTIHAASMYELIARIESAPMNVPRVMVANIDLVIFVGLVKKEGRSVRRVKEVVEILGTDPDTKELITNTIFRWDPINDSFIFSGRSFLFEKIEH
jgi:flagellar protein FlaI